MTKTGSRAVLAREREILAMRYRREGLSYRAIGTRLGVSEQAASKMVKVVMARTAEIASDTADAMRGIENERLDAIIEANMPFAMAGDAKNSMVIIAAIKRRCNMFGLDAPKVIEVEDRTDIDAKIADLLRRAQARYQQAQHSGQVQTEVDAGSTPRTIDARGELVVLALPSGSRVGEDEDGGRG